MAVYDVGKLEQALAKVDTEPVKLVKDKGLINALRRHIGRFEPNQ
ncbi:MAG: hypothetical protein DDT32_01385 [Syntrophomonadaceae bacterium]|nr:hypothetical protein [Bacillota bacterium]